MALDAVAVARAFEVMLPARDDALTLLHNPHLGVCNPIDAEAAKGEPCSVAEYLRRWNRYMLFTGPVEQMKAEVTGSLWVLYWTPRHTSSENCLAAATLPALAEWLQANGLAFGS